MLFPLGAQAVDAFALARLAYGGHALGVEGGVPVFGLLHRHERDMVHVQAAAQQARRDYTPSSSRP